MLGPLLSGLYRYEPSRGGGVGVCVLQAKVLGLEASRVGSGLMLCCPYLEILGNLIFQFVLCK